MKVLALGGCGDMGRMAVAVLLDSPKVNEVTVADKDFEKAHKYTMLLGSEKLGAAGIDVTNEEKLIDLMSWHDIIVNTVGPYYRFGKMILEAAIKAKKPYVDICDDWKPMLEILDMTDKAKEAGITAIVGMGASPGVLNLLAVMACSEFDEVDELKTAWGVALMKEGKKPQHYMKKNKFLKKIGAPPSKASAALIHLLYECIGKVPTFKEGKIIEIEALTKAGLFQFPGFNDTKVYHIGHPEPVTLPRTLKAKNISNLMFLGPTIMDMLIELKQKVISEELTLKEAAIQFEKFEDSLRKPKNIIKIYKEVKYHPPILCVNTIGTKDGEKKKISIGLKRAPYDEMAGITGVPLAIAALMIIDGKITAKGVLTPEESIEPMEFFNRLAVYCGRNMKGKDILIEKEENL